jgi:hypothetical protein
MAEADVHSAKKHVETRLRARFSFVLSEHELNVCTDSFIANADNNSSKLCLNAGFYSAHFDTRIGLRNPNPRP